MDRLPRPVDDAGRVVGAKLLADQEPVELADRREPPAGGTCRKTAIIEIAEIGANKIGVGIDETRPPASEELSVVVKIATIGGKR